MANALRFPNIEGVINLGGGRGRVVGNVVALPFEVVTSVGAGVAVTTIQRRLIVPRAHRVRGVIVQAESMTIVAGGTDPALDVYRHLPIPTGFSAALESPAVAGLVEDGVHGYAVVFTTAAGDTTPSAVSVVTVADKTVNGKVRLVVPLGPTGTTSRKLYRTEADLLALKLLATIADNTTITYLDNIADASLGAAAPSANAAAATILAATIKLSEATSDRKLLEQPLVGTLASAEKPENPDVWDPCMYTLRAVTGASTGALGNVSAWLEVEYQE